MRILKLLPLFGLILMTCPSHQLEFIPQHLKTKYGDALEAIFGMGVRLQALLQGPTTNSSDNFIVSPISAAMIIGQMMLGAEGEFLNHLHELISLPGKTPDQTYLLNTHKKDGQNVSHIVPYTKLHLQLGSLVRELKKSSFNRAHTLESSNALFVNRNVKLYPEFSHEIRLLYQTDLQRMNFEKSKEAMDTINKWASDHTNGLIKNILPTPPNKHTAAIFSNAVYFLAEWEQPFSDELNSRATFFVNHQTNVNVEFMSGFLEAVPYAESKTLNCKMLVLPYKNRELGMYFILPNPGHKNEYDIKKFAQEATAPLILEMVENLKNKDAVVKIPKISMTTSLSILEPLQKYASFKKANKEYQSANANQVNMIYDKIEAYENFKPKDVPEIVLTKAARFNRMTVSDILQQITFSINEKGTEAGVVTSSIMDYNGGSKSFLANKPFMFFIRHEATAATLFWGTISNPVS
ncbi:PREDICTED: leukocyte elastase inhibitor-like [Nicrophorus vespilloides]|uniref:Leukocyte elastase inhibitor-like n=1 Tax=Nicrophorus vespilloides TaxID=110193 RepID=A0ABM1MH93_NICVS|nr:PREDICTED: leukocyte elastase inhibitor-like [Nicrophorus vespilloides]XP_017773943.1 PREDICTED: leukocyte elastase inhibitor-like [Nicrophorus vespilloides]